MGHTAAVCYYRADLSYVGAQQCNGRGNQFQGGYNNQRGFNQNGMRNGSQGVPTANFFGSSQNFAGSLNHGVFSSNESVMDNAWYADSGATLHVTTDPSQLSNCSPYPGTSSLIVRNGHSLPILCVGSAVLSNAKSPLHFPNTLCVPDIKKNLLSISLLTRDNNIVIEFTNKYCLVKDSITKEVLLQGVLKDGLYQFSPSPVPAKAFLASHTSSISLWHLWLGHPTLHTLQQIMRRNLQLPCSGVEFCSICPLGKHYAIPFSVSNKMRNHVLDLIHTDLWGPSSITSSDGFNYYISFMDDCTRFTWIYPLKNKSEALKMF
ncbi:hypothetical protein Scep_010026 [Stephania cephalantha]|uniref:GAG-pre-integrase domain-containing protein n=1 Tax=Stephania cephalantha TaxID=152367 RepID=A0AAP0JVA5_9MAGN